MLCFRIAVGGKKHRVLSDTGLWKQQNGFTKQQTLSDVYLLLISKLFNE